MKEIILEEYPTDFIKLEDLPKACLVAYIYEGVNRSFKGFFAQVNSDTWQAITLNDILKPPFFNRKNSYATVNLIEAIHATSKENSEITFYQFDTFNELFEFLKD